MLISTAVFLAALIWLGDGLVVRMLHRRAKAAIFDRRVEDAKHLLGQALSLDDSNSETYFLLARTSRLQGKLANMKDYLSAASSRGHDVNRLRLEQWMGMAQIGDLQAGESALYAAMLESDKDSREICEALTSGYLRTWQIQKAMVIVDGWSSDFPDDPQPFLVKGRYFAGRGAWDSAVSALETGLQIAPSRLDIRIELAEALREEHQYQDAIAHFEKCLESVPQSRPVLVGLGRCCSETGETEKALAYARRAHVIASDDVDVLHLLGQVEASLGNYSEALEPLQLAFLERPFDPDIRYSYAMALRSSGRTKEAAEHFRYVEEQQTAQSQMRKWLAELEENPQQSDLRCSVGKTLLDYGDPAEGVLWLQSVLQFDPENETARKTLAEHFQKTGNGTFDASSRPPLNAETGSKNPKADEQADCTTEVSGNITGQ